MRAAYNGREQGQAVLPELRVSSGEGEAMMFEFTTGLMRTTHFDSEMAALADRHYSRRTVGARQFLYSGRKLVLRNAEGTVLFGWLFPDPAMRMDGQTGYNCAIFRNESNRKSSDIIIEAEAAAFAKWGPARLYTYIDPAKTAIIKRRCDSSGKTSRRIVGYCYLKAGWKPVIHKNGAPRISKAGQHLFVKLWRGTTR